MKSFVRSIYAIATAVSLFSASNISAGCGGVCVYYNSQTYQRGGGITETVSIHKGNSIVLSARYDACCSAMFGNTILHWLKNGTEIATMNTNSTNTVYQITVSDTGTYSVFFNGFVYPNTSYQCGAVRVIFENSNGGDTTRVPSIQTNAGSTTNMNAAEVFPNPFTNKIKIEYNGFYPGKLVLYNMLGMKACEMIIDNNDSGATEIQVPSGQISSGIYLYQLIDINNNVVKKGKITAQ